MTSATTPAAGRPVRVGVFGNSFASSILLPCLRQIPGVEVVGLSSPDQGRAQATASRFAISYTTADHRALLRDTRPDLVFVAVPPALHAPMAIDVLEAGAHVVCEKPMGLTVDECRRMVAVAAESGRVALIDHELRFLPHVRAMRQMLHEGAIGRPLSVTYTILSNTRWSADGTWSWWADAAQGGGGWSTMGAHMIDLLTWMLGPAQGVARGRATVIHPQRPDPATGALRAATADEHLVAAIPFATPAGFGTGHPPVIANIHISMAEPRRWHEIVITGEDGALRFSQYGPLETWTDGRWQVVDVADDLGPSAEYGIPDMYWSRAFLHFARRLIPAIAAGTAPDGAATFVDGLRTQEVLERAELTGP